MKGNDPSVTSIFYNYYLNTRADKSLCYGPGLNGDNKTSVETMFVIQSRNENGQNRKSGMDDMRV